MVFFFCISSHTESLEFWNQQQSGVVVTKMVEGCKKQAEVRNIMIWVNIFAKYYKSGNIFSYALARVLGICGTCFMLVVNNTLAAT